MLCKDGTTDPDQLSKKDDKIDAHKMQCTRVYFTDFSVMISSGLYDTILYETRCNFNMQSKVDMSHLNVLHGTIS